MTSAARQIAFINTAHGFCHYCLLILPTAVLAMALPGSPFGSEYGPILALATGMFVLYGALSLPQGWLAARFGRKHLMTVFFLGTGASLVLCGFAFSPWLLALALASTGAFAAIYHPIGTAMLVDAAGERPGRAIGINGVFGNFGVALAPVVTAFLVGRFGWHTAFMMPGIFCIAVGIAWMFVPAHDYATGLRVRPFPAIPRAIVRRAVVVLLLIAVVVRPRLQRLHPADPQAAAGAAGLRPTAPPRGRPGRLRRHPLRRADPVLGRTPDRPHHARRVFLPMALVLAPALAALSFLHGWAVLPAAGLVAAVIFGQVTVNETMTARYISPQLRARMYSVRFFVGFLGSSIAAPLVGLLHERTGSLAAVTLVLAGVASITVVCALFFPDRPEELRPEMWAVPAE